MPKYTFLACFKPSVNEDQSDHLALIKSSGNVRDKRGRWRLVTTATVGRCEDHPLVDHMTPNMLLKRNVAPHF